VRTAGRQWEPQGSLVQTSAADPPKASVPGCCNAQIGRIRPTRDIALIVQSKIELDNSRAYTEIPRDA
jgi:hypothetical protein